MNRLFAVGSQSIGSSASTSVLPMNIQDWFPLGLTGLISLLSTRTLRSLLLYHNSKASVVWCSALFMVQLSHPYTAIGKTIRLTLQIFVGRVMSLPFNTLSRFVIAFLLRSKCLYFHGCGHHLQWFWNLKKQNLSLFPLSLLLFTMKSWDWMPWS